MQDKQLWLQPDYFEGFKCKCGACRNCCCTGWDIAVGMDEYFRLIGMECPEEIHRRLECAFRVPDTPSPERFRLISPNWLGECPMHDEDGLCMIQRELGEAALPEICRMYPRCLKKEGELYEALCSNSCEAVVELLGFRSAVAVRQMDGGCFRLMGNLDSIVGKIGFATELTIRDGAFDSLAHTGKGDMRLTGRLLENME